MRIGLVDVDGHNFPNLPLMKLSAWYKRQGDSVEWYEPLLSGHMDRVYMSKVFSFSPDYERCIDADEVIKGGSGYCIHLEDGEEVYDTEEDSLLPPGIETIYPDYKIYYGKIPEVKNTAYGFMTRGCPRGCKFCHVGCKEGRKSYKAADLDTFWRGQKNIVLLDPNITACKDWKELFQQLIDSSAWVDFSQGIDIRLMTEEKAGMIKRIRTKNIHFAWDRYGDREEIIPKLRMFRELTGWSYQQLTVYVLTNFNTTHEQDLDRIYTLRDLGFNPYVMIYNKDDFVVRDKRGKPMRRKPAGELLKKYTEEEIKHFDKCWDLQGWVNNRIIFRSCNSFRDYRRR